MRTIHLRRGIITLIIRRKTKGIRDSGSREDEADTVYLLAKELAYDVVTGQSDNLAAALAKTSGKDIVQFAKAVEISAKRIDGKVCKTRSEGNDTTSGKSPRYGTYASGTGAKGTTDGSTALCGDAGHKGDNRGITGHSTTPETSKDFVTKTLKDGKNWPTSTEKSTGTASPKPKPNDNAKDVAKDLTKLTPEEKTIVAGLLEL
ncbi:hypothetical protein ANAPC5_00925 [Anaplasma phagocytophilum]|nr:hypothetical protein [Anaplasma phagocytophilum]SBO30784.1 hypothetical protein ANAPC3_00307 [Anaplasma phagocytophilum]SBO32518.1 hypothetical protein ANAPC2_01060 [Anaplasma phagocytophilum]SBO33025.1 hypothetical protein ANAPC4_01008 [Anaplasma phagocytophilum]SCV64648.1 hypothetical protein ANAPC5_00925 [Anaplasma phagocytophilum]